MIGAAAVAAWILSRPAWLDRDLTREQREPVVMKYATAIVAAAHNDVEVAELVALARSESATSARIGGGECPPKMCDHGTSRGWFQLKSAACPTAWAVDAGSVESIDAEARCAIAQLRHHAWRCREHALTPMVGAFAGYATGGDCHWTRAGERVLLTRRIAAELAKAEAR